MGNLSPSTVAVLPRLLVADDEPVILNRLMELGSEMGFNMRGAKDGAEAWKEYLEFKPDVVVLDIHMPCINGLAVLAQIKDFCPQCPVILITGFLQYGKMVQYGRVRPDGFLMKPLKAQRTSDLILKMLEKRLNSAEEKVEILDLA